MKNELLTELGQSLVTGSLTDPSLLYRTAQTTIVDILPEANVIKIGGQSVIDRGREAVLPLIDEIVENLGRHKMIIGTGAGTRARHAYSVGIDLGMSLGAYADEVLNAVSVGDLTHGLGKSVIFAALITLVAAVNGASVRGGAEGVGRATTRAVVQAIAGILITDMLFVFIVTRLAWR